MEVLSETTWAEKLSLVVGGVGPLSVPWGMEHMERAAI